eukprot:6186257-Pleurochrysis_carterae.AAC.2
MSLHGAYAQRKNSTLFWNIHFLSVGFLEYSSAGIRGSVRGNKVIAFMPRTSGKLRLGQDGGGCGGPR